MEILTRNLCKTCNGEGVVTHQGWLEIYEIEKQANQQSGKIELFSIEKCNEYFKERGYENVPPQEIKCVDCDGTGKIEEWMPISSFQSLIS